MSGSREMALSEMSDFERTMARMRTKGRLILVLAVAVVVGPALVTGLNQVPFPKQIGTSYYAAASAVIPLLLIAVLGRLADNRPASTGMVSRVERVDEERKATREQLVAWGMRIQAIEDELASLEANPEAADAAGELALLKSEHLAMTQEVEEPLLIEEPLLSLDRLALANIALVILVTLVAGIGEVAAFGQLATKGHSQAAFSTTNVGMTALFLAVIYFEALPWALLRHEQRHHLGSGG